ncbi:MAG: lamin tail domain-containing protein, partial [Opitutales bacterium]|nr:lamin tail domain-containing protein [Opitutales bacterium]
MRIRSILARQDSTGACLALAGLLCCAIPRPDVQGEILHRYSFEGKGSVAEDSIGGNHGSILGGTRLDGSGKVDLDGFDDYIELPPGMISKLKNTSFEVWTTWDGPTTSYWERIFDFGRDTRQYLYLSPRISVSPKKARFAITKTGSERKVNSSIALAGDKKTQYHIVVSYDDDNNSVSLYIDSVLQNSTLTTISLADIQDDHNWLGRSQFTMIPHYDGRITEFRIHDRALDLDSVKSSFQKGPDDLPGPVINAFRVDKSIVRSGENVKLIWDVTAGETLEIDGLPAISGANGFVETTITATTEFTLRAANRDGSRSTKTRVIVDDRPVIRSFSSSKYQVNAGDTITLNWDSRHAESVAIDEGVPVISGANGTVQVTINRDTVYTLTATNDAGRTTSSVRILLPRQVNPVISEIKSNNTTLKDNDGEYSDWIEIHNPGSSTIDLDGWFLTDNKDRRDKWRLPSRNLQPGNHLLVYCSGKDKSPANNGELHTNFRLSTDGSYLALSRPDKTVVHEFDPGYPLQFEEYSYGLSIQEKTETLIEPSETYSVYIPTNSAPADGWKGNSGLDEFDDSTWRSGPGGIGTLNFASEELLLDLKDDLQGKATSLYVRIPFQTDDEFFLLERLGLDLNYGDGFIAYLNGQEVARKNVSAGAG